MYLLDQLVFCQWDVVFVGRTTVAFVTYKQLFCGCLYKTERRETCSVFCHSLMQIKTAGSGGVAKEQIKHQQKNANKTEMPENICALGRSTELRLEMKCDY